MSQGLDEAKLLMDKLQGEKRALFMEGGGLEADGLLEAFFLSLLSRILTFLFERFSSNIH